MTLRDLEREGISLSTIAATRVLFRESEAGSDRISDRGWYASGASVEEEAER